MEFILVVSGVSYHIPSFLLGLFVLGVTDAVVGLVRGAWWVILNLRVSEPQ
jgi:hypothetical protein